MVSDMTTAEEPTTPTSLNERLVARLNTTVEAVTAGRMLQQRQPFRVFHKGGLLEHIGFSAATPPRDIEIICDVLEAIERGERISPDLTPGIGQASLPLG